MKKMLRQFVRWLSAALCLLLALCMLSSTALAVNGTEDQGEVPNEVLPAKPVVSIQGNVVVDNGKPTGFYELALCVRSPRKIVDRFGADVSEAAYEADIALYPEHATDGTYVVTYYPFSAAAATVNINTDVLTAVNWDVEEVTYSKWDAATGTYAADDTTYPRGVDQSVLDPELWPATGPDAFPDVTKAQQAGVDSIRVALDAEGDRSAFTAAAQVEDYRPGDSYAPPTALVSLSAHAPDNKPVVFTTDTIVAVARFSYDLKRFPKTAVNETFNTTNFTEQVTGEVGDPSNADGFWLGLDRGDNNNQVTLYHKTPLTWLADTDLDAANTYEYSDERAAASSSGQVVWTKLGVEKEGGFQETAYYYYLGAEGNGFQSDNATIQVSINGEPTPVSGVKLPDTMGDKVLTPGADLNVAHGGTTAEYTYFKNLLRLGDDHTLKLKLVNEPTFKKPTGTGGTTILFYDWDDRLIGSLIVGKGDVRAQVNSYIEKTLVHPDLRSDSTFMADESGMTQADKYSSLQRDYTYRGKYAYTPGGNDATLGVADGEEYPLTNKLDYVFTKRVNTVLTQTENGDEVRYVHPYSLNDPDLDAYQADGGLYPWVYGWAVVEDDSASNGRVGATGAQGNWKVMHDADKREDVWTTMGTGELAQSKPGNIATPSTVATVDPLAVRSAPEFLASNDPAWTDGTRADANDYAYTLTGENAYLRFADFSDITSEMERYDGKDTLVVKAVYEPGERLMNGFNYRLITEPAYTKWNNVSAVLGGAYKVQATIERSYIQNGAVVGTTRVRMPAIQQDTTIDYKWLSDPSKGVNNDLDNTDYDTSVNRDESIYARVDTDNGEQITFSLSLSPRQNKVDYVLVELYTANFVTGTQRSYTNNEQKGNFNLFIPDNYNYLAGADSDIQDDLYDCDFSTKEGSHGFVLYGTLGHFLEQATKRNHGEIVQSAYENAVQDENAMDANLRMTLGGVQPSFMDGSTIQDAFLAAAARCEVHKGDPTYDCWDDNLDCAKLTYHQAQWFLLDYQSNPGCDILTVAEAEDANHKLPFCHYHITCSGGHVPVAPTTWQGLVDKLREYNNSTGDDRTNARADLDAMELSTLDSLTFLRSSATGGKYGTVTAFVDALLAADAQLKNRSIPVTWPSLQYAILHGAPLGTTAADMRDEAQEKYWWYAGAGAAPRITEFAELLAAAESTYVPVTLKDGDATFLPKSALSAATYPNNVLSYLTSTDPTKGQRNAWVTLTDNLVPSHSETLVSSGDIGDGDEYFIYDYGRYGALDDFLSQFTAAFDAVQTDIQGGAPTPADKDEWWRALQTKLLPAGDNLGDYDSSGEFTFWWKSGNSPFRVSNLTTLVECARRLANGSPGDDEYDAAKKEWDRLTIDDIESDAISQGLLWKNNDPTRPASEALYPTHGADLQGDGKAEMLRQLQVAVAAYQATNLPLAWDQLQYLILNPGADLQTELAASSAQAVYYWWKNGTTAGTTVTLTPNATETTLNRNLTELIKATYRSAFNDPGVLRSLKDAAAADADGTFWSYTRLATQRVQGTTFDRVTNTNDTYTGPDVLSDLTPAHTYPGATDADVNAFLNMLSDFRDKAKADQGVTDAYGAPKFTWQQVQYYVLNGGTYLPAGDQIIKDLTDKDAALAGDYWWYYADQRVPPDPPKADAKPEEASDALLRIMETYLSNGKTPTITIADFNALQIFNARSATGGTLYATNGANKTKNQTAMRNKLKTLADAVKTTEYYNSETGEIRLYWSQIQYWWINGTFVDNVTALTAITGEWGWTKGTNGIPADVDLSVIPGGASLLAEEVEWEEPEVPLAEPAAALGDSGDDTGDRGTVPAVGPHPTEGLSPLSPNEEETNESPAVTDELSELDARIAELEQVLSELRAQRAQLTGETAEPAGDSGTTAGDRGTVPADLGDDPAGDSGDGVFVETDPTKTPSPCPPEETPEEHSPARPEIPLGEEATSQLLRPTVPSFPLLTQRRTGGLSLLSGPTRQRDCPLCPQRKGRTVPPSFAHAVLEHKWLLGVLMQM